MIGCKLLCNDGSSLTDEHGRVHYPVGEWIDVPGNGAYVAISGELTAGGTGPLLVYLECEEPTGAEAPEGVVCYRRVRRLAEAAPDRVSAELRGWVARDAPDLSVEQRLALAAESTPEWRGRVAAYAPGLSAEQRMALARESAPELRGQVARDAPDLSVEQRLALAAESTPEWRGQVARDAPGLSAEQRAELLGRVEAGHA